MPAAASSSVRRNSSAPSENASCAFTASDRPDAREAGSSSSIASCESAFDTAESPSRKQERQKNRQNTCRTAKAKHFMLRELAACRT